MKVLIYYFKSSGKFYTEEETEWPEDPKHYDGWAHFDTIVRLRTMHAVCIETPLGHPVFTKPIDS